jgi:hypothetical protein
LVATFVLTTWQTTNPVAIPARQHYPQEAEGIPALKRYYQVVDFLFPRKPLNATPSLILLTLRYTPPFKKESQIVVTRDLKGAFVVTYYCLPEGRERIAERIAQITEKSSTADPREIAARIDVKAQKVNVPDGIISDLMTRYARLRMPVDLALDPTVVILDATQYQLWYETVSGEGEIYVSFPTHNYRKDHPIHWMIDVKRVVEKYAATD